MKHGGHLIPTYDPDIVTHIVTDVPRTPTLRALGYKRLKEIPDHIPTVKWSWILSAIGRIGRLDKEDIKTKMEDVWYHAAFSERMDTSADRSKSIMPKTRDDRKLGMSASEAPNGWVCDISCRLCRINVILQGWRHATFQSHSIIAPNVYEFEPGASQGPDDPFRQPFFTPSTLR